jgi:GrpB-like predicted nucleotidyltransferase (UPF0157 family)
MRGSQSDRGRGVVAGSLSLRNHLVVREVLRANPVLRDMYGAANQRVGAAAKDIYEYGAGKDAIVQRILAEAGRTEHERASIANNGFRETHRCDLQ